MTVASPSARNRYLPVSPGFSLPLPPTPVRFPRAPLDIKLAVLLLRSTYECVDGMDACRWTSSRLNFGRRVRRSGRAAERTYNAPLTIEQGKLQDPLYFDFISFVQAEVIAAQAVPKSASVSRSARARRERLASSAETRRSRTTNSYPPSCARRGRGSGLRAHALRVRGRAVRGGVTAVRRASERGGRGGGGADSVRRPGMRSIADALAGKGCAAQGEREVATPARARLGDARSRRAGRPGEPVGGAGVAARGVSPPPNEYAGFALTAFCRACGVRSSYQAKSSDVATELEFELGE